MNTLTVVNSIVLVILVLKPNSMTNLFYDLSGRVRRLERRYVLTQALDVIRTKESLDYSDMKRLSERVNINSVELLTSWPSETMLRAFKSRLERELAALELSE